MSRYFYIILFLSAMAVLPVHGAAGDISEATVKKALSQLDDSLAVSQRFVERRQAAIDRLKSRLETADDPVQLTSDLILLYTSFDNDSAMYYATRGMQLSDGVRADGFRIRRAALLPLAGYFETAMREFAKVDSLSFPVADRAEYYASGRQMYSYINSLGPGFAQYNDSLTIRLMEMNRGLISYLPEGSLRRRFFQAEYYMLIGDYVKAADMLAPLLDDPSQEARMYRARVAHHLATIANRAGNDHEYIYYLTMSAMADVTAATLEVKALQELGSILYKHGDIDRAYRYLSRALENAVDCGAQMRMVESARALPLIEQAHTAQLERQQRTIIIVIVVLILLLCALATLLVIHRREMSHLRRLQQHLRTANDIKEVYISQFLSLCSIYMDKMSDFSKLVYRKLSVGKVDELINMTKSGKLVEEQSQEFYEVFDNAFLHLYPDFVSQVNALLRPEAHIELKEGEILNTELRILAFMRLGIQESQRIARVLHYSLNTIYNYRNRLKNRAINRDTFEDDIMHLSSI